MYVPSLIQISFVISKIWPGQATVMKNKWLRGDNSVCSAVHFLRLPSIYNPSFISIQFVLSKISPRQASIIKLNGKVPLIAIYLYTKFYLNAISSFKAICRTRYRTDGQTDKAATICFPFGKHNKGLL